MRNICTAIDVLTYVYMCKLQSPDNLNQLLTCRAPAFAHKRKIDIKLPTQENRSQSKRTWREGCEVRLVRAGRSSFVWPLIWMKMRSTAEKSESSPPTRTSVRAFAYVTASIAAGASSLASKLQMCESECLQCIEQAAQ
jgi:hypothetical protein